MALSACATRSQSGDNAAALDAADGTGGICVPISERGMRELGCYITAIEQLGALPSEPIFWHVTRYPDRSAAEAAVADAASRGTRSTVVESLGSVWLFAVQGVDWRSSGGEQLARIGPLPVRAGTGYNALYMEAVFRPGMKSIVHRHSGPEAWYTLAGETCLETPDGTRVGRAGGEHVIIPEGSPMELTATGTSLRRSLVLILHDSAQAPSYLETTWKPKGVCRR